MSAPPRRELHFWEAIALSMAIMAPTAAMALNGALVVIAAPHVAKRLGERLTGEPDDDPR